MCVTGLNGEPEDAKELQVTTALVLKGRMQSQPSVHYREMKIAVSAQKLHEGYFKKS